MITSAYFESMITRHRTDCKTCRTEPTTLHRLINTLLRRPTHCPTKATIDKQSHAWKRNHCPQPTTGHDAVLNHLSNRGAENV